MRRTRSRRRIDLDDDVSASPPNMLLINNTERTPRESIMRRRSMGTPSLALMPNSPNHVDSPRTLNETFSPEPEEKVFSVKTLIDSVKKQKRHTSSHTYDSNAIDTPRVTRASTNFAKKSLTSIKKELKESPVFANLKKVVSKTPKTTFFETVGQVADVVAGERKVIKSIRKRRRSSAMDDTLTSEKKNVKFHSPANMEVSTFDIDIKMQSDRKVKRLRSLSNAESEKDKSTKTPEKIEKKTPGSRKKMPNFSEIHQRQFEKMESITEHAARKAERANYLSRSPKIISQSVEIKESETEIVPKLEAEGELLPKPENETEQESVITISYHESEVKVIKEPTEVAQDLKSVVAPEPVEVIMLEPELEVKEELITEEQSLMLLHEEEPLVMAELDNLGLQSGSTSTSPVVKSPLVVEKFHLEPPSSKLNLSFTTMDETHRENSLVGRSPFVIQMQESFSIPAKTPVAKKRPLTISKIPAKVKQGGKSLPLPNIRPKAPIRDLNARVTKIPQTRINSSVLVQSNKNKAATNLNSSGVFVFNANKPAVKKPVVSAPPQGKLSLKRIKPMATTKPLPTIPKRPAKENHIVDKVKERQQKNMSLYKGRPEPDVKPRTPAPKNMIAVRTNKRFELQMKFRQMNGNN